MLLVLKLIIYDKQYIKQTMNNLYEIFLDIANNNSDLLNIIEAIFAVIAKDKEYGKILNKHVSKVMSILFII